MRRDRNFAPVTGTAFDYFGHQFFRFLRIIWVFFRYINIGRTHCFYIPVMAGIAVTFGKKDDAVVATLVRFLDARGKLLKQHRGELRDGQPVVAELSRRELSLPEELLVRIEVVHKLPGIRESRYPILVTAQPIAVAGFARFSVDWNTGSCGCPKCGPPVGSGPHVDCEPALPTDI